MERRHICTYIWTHTHRRCSSRMRFTELIVELGASYRTSTILNAFTNYTANGSFWYSLRTMSRLKLPRPQPSQLLPAFQPHSLEKQPQMLCKPWAIRQRYSQKHTIKRRCGCAHSGHDSRVWNARGFICSYFFTSITQCIPMHEGNYYDLRGFFSPRKWQVHEAFNQWYSENLKLFHVLGHCIATCCECACWRDRIFNHSA